MSLSGRSKIFAINIIIRGSRCLSLLFFHNNVQFIYALKHIKKQKTNSLETSCYMQKTNCRNYKDTMCETLYPKLYRARICTLFRKVLTFESICAAQKNSRLLFLILNQLDFLRILSDCSQKYF